MLVKLTIFPVFGIGYTSGVAKNPLEESSAKGKSKVKQEIADYLLGVRSGEVPSR